MFATDFLFDGQRASDFGCMICSFNGSGGLETAEGGQIEYNAVKPTGSNEFRFYGSQFNTTVTWSFSICKNPCRKGDGYFDQYEESMVKKWLVKTDGYRMMQFDQSGYEDICYNVYFNVEPRQILGKTVGFDLTATSDCAYGYTGLTRIAMGRMDSSTQLKFNVHSDINAYILPTVKIYRGSAAVGDFSINNYSDTELKNPILDEPMVFKNIQGNIVMEPDIEAIEGLTRADDSNWSFLKLKDGMNIITTDSDIGFGIELLYREPRHIRI